MKKHDGTSAKIIRRSLISGLLACSAMSGMAYGQSWTGAIDTDPAKAGNWSPATVPSSGSIVVIDSQTNAPVIDTAIVFDWGRVTVGGNTAGTLTVRGGATLNSGALGIGGGQIDGTAGNGTMLITGAGTLVTSASQIYVAPQADSQGNLTVETGAVLRGSSLQIGIGDRSTGVVTVTGAGSLLDHGAAPILMGNRGTDSGVGTLNILDGGQVTGASTSQFVGLGSTINIRGANALLSSRSSLGLDGALLVEAGGAISYDSIAIGGIATLRNGTMSVTSSSGLGVSAGGTLVADDSTITVGAQFNVAGSATLRSTSLSAPQIGISQNGILNIGGADGAAAGAPGTLTIQSITVGEPNSRLVFNHTGSDLVVGATIGGNGQVLHQSGTTILTAANAGGSSVTGIDVTGGTLLSNGLLRATAMTVATGGTLGGSGTVEASVAVTNGIVAPGSRGVGTLILGNLSLTATSVLNYELGAPGTPGVGSDLLTLGTINTGGNLTLDGTLNVANVGGFGAGLYRLIDYKGALTDNGLNIGAVPSGFASTDLTVQTATAQQVNLLVGTPISNFAFWDGANTSGNAVVNGGTGAWTATATNWTLSDGARNGAYDPAALLIFADTAGTVTVDNSAGDVLLGSGAQFAVDGYRVTGEALRLDAAATTFRIGDGTAAGASHVTTIDSMLTGVGGLAKTDLGTLVLTAANSYTGGTSVASGTIRGNAVSLTGPITIAATGTVQFDQASDGAYAGILSGSGTLRKTGSGLLSITGTSRAFGGSASVEAGTMNIAGVLTGQGGLITVGAPATLTGNGTIASLDVIGRISPGSGVATLTVEGDVTFRTGSTYAVDLAAAGGADRIAASGRATLEGGTVAVTALDPQTSYVDGSVYRILDAPGGRTGTFAGLSEQSEFLDFVLGHDATGASVTIRQVQTFPDVALTYNQRQAATALKSLVRPSGSDALAVYNSILMLNGDAARAAFDASSGEIYANLLSARQRQGMALAGQFAMRGQAGLDEGLGLWGGITGHDGHVSGDGNGARFRWDGIGGEMGLDYRGVSNGWAVGIGGGWQSGGVDAAARGSHVKTDEWHLGGYLRYGTGAEGFTALGTLVHARADADVTRAINYGTISRSARASTKVATTAVAVDLRYGLTGGEWTFGPTLGAEYGNSRLGAFRETGGNSLDLFAARNRDAWTRYGLGGFARFGGKQGYIDVTARYVTGKRNDAAVDLGMAGSSQPFNVRAPVGARSGAKLQASGRYNLGGNWSIAGQVGAIRGDDAEVNGNLRLSFAL